MREDSQATTRRAWMGKMCRRTLGKKGQQREIVVVIVVGLFLPQREERIGHWLKGRKER